MANENNPTNSGPGTGSTASGAEAQGHIDAAKSQVRQAADDLRAAAEAKGRDIRDAATAKAEDLRNQAEEYYGQAKQRAEDYYDQAKDRARTLQEDGEAYVRENPLRAVLIAVGAGFILGNLFRR